MYSKKKEQYSFFGTVYFYKNDGTVPFAWKHNGKIEFLPAVFYKTHGCEFTTAKAEKIRWKYFPYTDFCDLPYILKMAITHEYIIIRNGEIVEMY